MLPSRRGSSLMLRICFFDCLPAALFCFALLCIALAVCFRFVRKYYSNSNYKAVWIVCRRFCFALAAVLLCLALLCSALLCFCFCFALLCADVLLLCYGYCFALLLFLLFLLLCSALFCFAFVFALLYVALLCSSLFCSCFCFATVCGVSSASCSCPWRYANFRGSPLPAVFVFALSWADLLGAQARWSTASAGVGTRVRGDVAPSQEAGLDF